MQVLKEDIRGRILTDARQQFEREGYSKTSMRELAELSSVGVGNIYNYLPNNEELFREGKVYFARARRNGSNGFPVVAEVLPRRQLHLNMLPEEFTDAHYVFADCEAEGRRYRNHREFFRR